MKNSYFVLYQIGDSTAPGSEWGGGVDREPGLASSFGTPLSHRGGEVTDRWAAVYC